MSGAMRYLPAQSVMVGGSSRLVTRAQAIRYRAVLVDGSPRAMRVWRSRAV